MPAKSAEKNTAADSKPNRQRELEAAISTITKSYGEGAIMRLGDANAQQKIEVIPTGALSFDLALGVGGVPRGRIVEIYGPESSGKTTVMLHIIANAQKAGGSAATESTTMTSSALERARVSQIVRASSPLSGWETSSSSRLTPSLRA